MEILKNRGYLPYPLSQVKTLFKGSGPMSAEDTIRYVYAILNQEDCLFIASIDPPKMKDVLKNLNSKGSLLAKELNPATEVYIKAFSDAEVAIQEENEIRTLIKPKYNALALFHGIFESIKSPEAEEDNATPEGNEEPQE
ncbi:hypothetical protein [Adhaeribacter aquaticus]|uniref:hypothetical protein n=1 Tax=Adhaeribacter aquaticus TaxID=299567 RepID=UPI00040F00A5|nr:hypothetical protein [Adhaeribacter aquaticus]